MGLRQMLPVQTKRMRFGFATMKGGEFTDGDAGPQLRTSVRFAPRLACTGAIGINVPMSRMLLRFLPCLAMLLVAGCSTFEKRFAAASKLPVKNGQPASAYAGKWASASHPGGGGRLRCILSPVDASGYRADFHATWHGLSSEHSVVLHTKPAARGKSGAREFEGTSVLHTPIGAGTYRCSGRVDAATMRACYDATYDRGTFEMSRVVPQTVRR